MEGPLRGLFQGDEGMGHFFCAAVAAGDPSVVENLLNNNPDLVSRFLLFSCSNLSLLPNNCGRPIYTQNILWAVNVYWCTWAPLKSPRSSVATVTSQSGTSCDRVDSSFFKNAIRVNQLCCIGEVAGLISRSNFWKLR